MEGCLVFGLAERGFLDRVFNHLTNFVVIDELFPVLKNNG